VYILYEENIITKSDIINAMIGNMPKIVMFIFWTILAGLNSAKIRRYVLKNNYDNRLSNLAVIET